MSNEKNSVDVILHNDETTSMQTVALVLTALFGRTDDEAESITMKAHNEGQAVIGSFDAKDARRKIELVKLIARSASCDLRCTISSELQPDLPQSPRGKEVIPKGWYKSGAAPNHFHVEVETGAAHTGTKCASMQNIVDNPDGFGTLMSHFGPDEYAGKRMRMRLWVKSEPDSQVQPWLRVDGTKRGETLAFDNWCERPIYGPTAWAEHTAVLDISPAATNIAFGVMLAASGKFYVDDVSFEVVGNDVPTTDCACFRKTPAKKPTNLNFED